MTLLQHFTTAISIALLSAASYAIDDSTKSEAWGHPNHGLTSRIEITGRQFAPAKSILVLYTVRNLATYADEDMAQWILA
jgi:hypothetical protein